MDIGNQIRDRRQRLGLSQEELARRLYVSRVTVSHWETSKTLPDVQSILLLANLFGTTTAKANDDRIAALLAGQSSVVPLRKNGLWQLQLPNRLRIWGRGRRRPERE